MDHKNREPDKTGNGNRKGDDENLAHHVSRRTPLSFFGDFLTAKLISRLSKKRLAAMLCSGSEQERTGISGVESPAAHFVRCKSEHRTHDMSTTDNIDRVWDLIEEVGVCMLTTRFAGGLRARPLEARPNRDAGLICFVSDIHSAKEDEIEAAPDVGLVFIDASNKAYLSITGRACVMRDAEKIKLAWRKTDEVWWPGGPNDPNVCLLRIEPVTAELWDGPASAAVTAFEFAKARLTGEEPNLGENRKVTVKM